MANEIHFTVHRNPLPDADGSPTYQVRQDPWYTVEPETFLELVETHQQLRAGHLQHAITAIEDELVKQLFDNKRVHLGHIGTFSLKLGFRKRRDDEGQEAKPVFTDPNDITGDAVVVEGISFVPDRQLIDELTSTPCQMHNIQSRGKVGHSAVYGDDEMRRRVADYVREHGYLTVHRLRQDFGLTKYMARKWLNALTEGPNPLLRGEKEGTTMIFRMI